MHIHINIADTYIQTHTFHQSRTPTLSQYPHKSLLSFDHMNVDVYVYVYVCAHTHKHVKHAPSINRESQHRESQQHIHINMSSTHLPLIENLNIENLNSTYT
jgi:hypothetical protein